ncbi:MAG: isopentenyl-diphosphate delta-isomerase [Actinobacteria bacterium]|nr:MAG: isopentenyl-diphosphate delta-isomerase [Actinomycetota bacterium]
MTPRYNSSQQYSSHSPRKGKRRTGTDETLIRDAESLDGRPYGAYNSLLGDWDYGDFSLSIDRIQADPYAPPSSLRVSSKPKTMGLPDECLATTDSRLATADFLVRSFEQAIHERCPRGAVHVARTGQEILQRSAATVTSDFVEVRFQLHMPARGRTILGREAARILDIDIPDIVMDTFDFVSAGSEPMKEKLLAHIAAYEDYCALRAALVENNWVTFVADEAILARRSGVSQKPLTDSVPFRSPDTLRRSVTLPHAGTITGMAIEPGVTVIVGGGYHGKSTLLSAIARGVYAHIPADGRERVATLPDAMKVRAADGRSVTGVNVSPFITHLPGGADTTSFSTENASGSTSQAAAIVEAVELGSPLLLIDEDTSATNLLIRDARMRELVAAEKEPITPLVDRIGALARERNVSTIMVMGGSGDYLDVADRVIMLDHYTCADVSERARTVVAAMPRARSDVESFEAPDPRIPLRSRGGDKKGKTKASGLSTIVLDKQTVDVSDVEHIVDPGQTEAIAWLMRGILEEYANARTPLVELLARMERTLNSERLDAVEKFGSRPKPAFLVRPRMVDVGAAINRYRALHLE